MKTRILSIILLAVMLIPMTILTACGESASYASDIAVTELSAAADAKLPDPDDFATMTSDYIVGMMEIDTSAFADYAVKLRASGANIDEYGIFKAPTEADVAGVEATVKAYLAKRVESWMPEYMPEEFPKMQAATVKVMGQYVVYCILSEDVKTEVFTAIENILLGK